MRPVLLEDAGIDAICRIYCLRLQGGCAKASEKVKHVSDIQTIQDERQLDARTELRLKDVSMSCLIARRIAA